MTITRIINGTAHDFELTPEELYSAYFEQEHNLDREDVETILDGYTGPDDARDFEQTYGKPLSFAREHIHEIAAEKRNVQDNGLTWTEAVDAALEYCLA